MAGYTNSGTAKDPIKGKKGDLGYWQENQHGTDYHGHVKTGHRWVSMGMPKSAAPAAPAPNADVLAAPIEMAEALSPFAAARKARKSKLGAVDAAATLLG
jgi:hypothetical protein